MSDDKSRPAQQLVVPKGARFALVWSRFNQDVVNKLVEGARDCLKAHSVKDSAVVEAEVPGAWELPWAARRLAGEVDAVIALGAVIRGDTPHFDYVAGEAARGLAHVMAETGTPVAFGVLTTDTAGQAHARAGGRAGNKGWDAALTAIEMAGLSKKLPEPKP